MNYSVVIPTHNRLTLLRHTLECIETELIPLIEVIVVVDGDNLEFYDSIQKAFPFVKWKHCPLRVGAPEARNIGARDASGSRLIFIDDDCEVQKGFFKNLDSAWNSINREVVCGIVGAIDCPHKSVVGRVQNYFDSYGNRTKNVLKPCTSNFSILKEVFEQSGGFHPYLEGAEDVELGVRVRKLGFKIRYDPAFRVSHLSTKKTLWALAMRNWNWATKGEGHLSRLYPEHFKWYFTFGFLESIRLHLSRRQDLGWNLHLFPFTLLLFIVKDFGFLWSFIRHRKRHFRFIRHRLKKDIYSPFDLIFSATSKCNFKCGHCFYHEQLNRKQDLTYTEFIPVIKRFGKIDTLAMTGGEPFERKDLVKLIEAFYLNSSIFEVDLPSNGWYLPRMLEGIEELEKRAPLLKINCFISFHGNQREHDATTGIRGSFDRAIHSLFVLNEKFGKHKRFHLSTLVCVHRKNIESIKTLVDRLQQTVPGIHVNLFPVREGVMDPQLGPLSENQHEELKKMISYVERKKGRSNSKFQKRVKEAKLGDLLSGYRENMLNQTQFINCFGGKSVSKLEETGRWRPCEIRREYFDLAQEVDSVKLNSVLKSIERKECSCNHDCFFKGALDAHPGYQLKHFLQATFNYQM